VTGAALMSKIDAIERRAAERFNIPGMSVAIARGDQIVARTRGVADLQAGEALSRESVFPVGSITKTIKAAVAMRLVERKRLALDTPLVAFAPGLPPAVQIRHLLQQTSGLSEMPEDVDTFDAMVASLVGKPLVFEPGTQWAYNNTNYDLLGALLERAAGASLEDIVIDDMMRPLGLHRLGPCSRVRPTVTGYRLEAGRMVPTNDTYGMCASAEDLARWGLLLLRGAVVDHRSVVAMTSGATLTSGEHVAYGFGLDLRPYRGHRRFWHTGHLAGHVAALAIYPDDDLVVAALFNLGSFPHPEVVELAVTRAVLGLEEPNPRDLHVSADVANRVVGTYDASDILCRISRRGDHLVMELLTERDGDPYLRTTLLYQGGGQFVSEEAPESVGARFDVSQHRAQTAVCDMVGIRWVGKRIQR